MRGERTIAGQYGGTSGQKQQHFGRIDPFVLFAVLPMLTIAVISFWGGIAVIGLILVFLVALIVVGDSWANRPRGRAARSDRADRAARPARAPRPAGSRVNQRSGSGSAARRAAPRLPR